MGQLQDKSRASGRRTGLDRGRVLVADRDPVFAAGAVDLLRREGYTAGAVSARGIERRARRFAPELVLLGPGLPEGLERHTIAGLRTATRTAGVPVFRIADGRSVAGLSAAFAAGLDDCIARPFFPDELFGRMDRALERYRAMRRLQNPAGLPTGVAAEFALGECLRRMEQAGSDRATGFVLFLPGVEALAASDRARDARWYRALWREIPHRLVDLLAGLAGAVGVRVTAGELSPGVVVVLEEAGAFDDPNPVLPGLSRLLFACDRWLESKGASGGFLFQAPGGGLKRAPMPRLHALVVTGEGWMRGPSAVMDALALELERDDSGRAGGRLRRSRL